MKPFSRFLCTVLASSALNCAAFANLPVTFTLSVDPTGVAIQFDLTSTSSLEAIGYPSFEGTSDHDVRSATIASGAHRFVVYSTTGEPIASTGEVSIVFSPKLIPANQAVTISNVTASNASGDVVTASPNALPVLTQGVRSYQSLELGESIDLDTVVYDLDGNLSSLKLLNDGSEVAATSTAPFSLAWTPTAAGSFPLSLVAVDNKSQQSVFDLGIHRAYSLSEITDYSTYASIHYGDSPDAGFTADPLKNGFSNGFAYLLGVNPYTPDRSHLPVSRIEKTETGLDLVLTFVRRSNLAGINWHARSSPNLQEYETLESTQISETDNENGFHAVELRVPLNTESPQATFIDLEVNQSS